MLWKQKVPRLIRGQVNMSQRLKFLLFYSDVVAMAVYSAVYNYHTIRFSLWIHIIRYSCPSIKGPSDLVAEWLTRLLLVLVCGVIFN